MADCKEAPTAEWRKTLDQFYTGKFATILDGFDVDAAHLTPVHRAQLDGIAAKLRADAALKAQLGGACDLIEEQRAMLSLQRAENARDYLAGKGVAQGRLEIQSYGSDWARVETQRMMAEGKNRRFRYGCTSKRARALVCLGGARGLCADKQPRANRADDRSSKGFGPHGPRPRSCARSRACGCASLPSKR